MIKKDPRQDIYDTIWRILAPLAPVYDFLPPPKTPYPFIRPGEYQGEDITNKSCVFGTYYQMIHFWWEKDNRIGLTNTMTLVKQDLRELTKTPGGFQLSKITLQEQVIPDIEDTTQLLHGVLIINLQFN